MLCVCCSRPSTRIDFQSWDLSNLNSYSNESFIVQLLITLGSLSFGIATATTRLTVALEQLVHWLPNSGCPLHVISPPATVPDIRRIEDTFATHAINLTVMESTLEFPIAYFSLLKLLYDTRLPSTEWLVLIDDDTFVPSLASLVDYLNINYNSSKPVMVAAATEDMHQVNAWGLIPYGGGGIFVSVPLAEILVRPEIWVSTCHYYFCKHLIFNIFLTTLRMFVSRGWG